MRIIGQQDSLVSRTTQANPRQEAAGTGPRPGARPPDGRPRATGPIPALMLARSVIAAKRQDGCQLAGQPRARGQSRTGTTRIEAAGTSTDPIRTSPTRTSRILTCLTITCPTRASPMANLPPLTGRPGGARAATAATSSANQAHRLASGRTANRSGAAARARIAGLTRTRTPAGAATARAATTGAGAAGAGEAAAVARSGRPGRSSRSATTGPLASSRRRGQAAPTSSSPCRRSRILGILAGAGPGGPRSKATGATSTTPRTLIRAGQPRCLSSSQNTKGIAGDGA